MAKKNGINNAAHVSGHEGSPQIPDGVPVTPPSGVSNNAFLASGAQVFHNTRNRSVKVLRVEECDGVKIYGDQFAEMYETNQAAYYEYLRKYERDRLIAREAWAWHYQNMERVLEHIFDCRIRGTDVTREQLNAISEATDMDENLIGGTLALYGCGSHPSKEIPRSIRKHLELGNIKKLILVDFSIEALKDAVHNLTQGCTMRVSPDSIVAYQMDMTRGLSTHMYKLLLETRNGSNLNFPETIKNMDAMLNTAIDDFENRGDSPLLPHRHFMYEDDRPDISVSSMMMASSLVPVIANLFERISRASLNEEMTERRKNDMYRSLAQFHSRYNTFAARLMAHSIHSLGIDRKLGTKNMPHHHTLVAFSDINRKTTEQKFDVHDTDQGQAVKFPDDVPGFLEKVKFKKVETRINGSLKDALTITGRLDIPDTVPIPDEQMPKPDRWLWLDEPLSKVKPHGHDVVCVITEQRPKN